MITNAFLAKENKRLRLDKDKAMEQLEAACESLGNIRAIDPQLFNSVTKDTNLSRKAIAELIGDRN